MDEVKIFVELPHEMEKWLIQNETSLARLLRQQGVEVRESHELNPFWQDDGNVTARELSLSFAVNCMAAAAFVAAVGMVADNILATMNKRTEQAAIRSLTVVRDAKGNPVFGKDGKPVYELAETPVLLEPRAENTTTGVEFQMKTPKDGAVFLLLPSGDSPAMSFRAFVVGADYLLQFARADAERIADALENLGYQLPEPRIPPPEECSDSIIARLKKFATDSRPDDTLLFYFAGHGIPHEDLYLVLHLYDPDRNPIQTCLSMIEISNVFKRSTAATKNNYS